MLLQLNIDSREVLAEDYNVNLFLELVDKVSRNREYKNFNDGLNSNFVQFINPGTRLMLKFRSV